MYFQEAGKRGALSEVQVSVLRVELLRRITSLVMEKL